MNRIYLIIILLSLNYSFSQESNLQLIDNAKTKLPAKKITKLIVGNWEFEKLTDSTKMNTIEEVIHKINDTISTTEIVKRPSVIIKKDGTYKQYNCPSENCESGKWEYNSKEKVISFKYNEPKYNVPIDRLAPGLLEQLKESGQLIVIEGFEWEITEINKDELVIIEHLPHNEFEFKYNLRVYRKNKQKLKLTSENNFGKDSIIVFTPNWEKIFIGTGQISLEKLILRESQNLPKNYNNNVLNQRINSPNKVASALNELKLPEELLILFGNVFKVIGERGTELHTYKVGDFVEISKRVSKSTEFKPFMGKLKKLDELKN